MIASFRSSKMERWSKLQHDSSVYIIKCDRKNSGNIEPEFNFWLSDFKELWHESFATKDDLFKRITDANPALIIDGIEHNLIEMLGKIDTKTATIGKATKISENGFQLEMKFYMDGGVTVKFDWCLEKCNSQAFFEQITKKLLHQIGELELNVKQLIGTVKSKDKEIAEYIAEGAAPLHRKQFVTQKFDETQITQPTKLFNCEMDEFEGVIGTLSKMVVTTSTEKNEPTKKTTPTKPRPRFTNRPKPKFVDPHKTLWMNSDEEDDDDADENQYQPVATVKRESNTANNQTTKEVSPPKRRRRDFDPSKF